LRIWRGFAAGIALAILPISAVCQPGLAAEEAVTYQINPAHDGSIKFKKGFTPPLRRKWVRDLGGKVSYPVIANDMVFVTVRVGDHDGTRVVALDLKTGDTVWEKPIPSTISWSNAAYDDGRLFVINFDGLLRAFDAKVGSLVWSTQLTGQYDFRTAPIAHNGQVFLNAQGVGRDYLCCQCIDRSGAVEGTSCKWKELAGAR
jgi:outer membrane protein assembly factor BamB